MQLRGATIEGLGSYVPQRRLTNDDLAKIVDTSDEWIVSHTGIRERRILSNGQATSDLAYEASVAALADAQLEPDALDMIIVATVTPDMPLPATAALLQDRFGISGVATYDLLSGCTGWIQGLATGAQFVQTRTYDHVLVIAAEALTRATNWQDRSTCVLFGDGACAAVVGPCRLDRGILSIEMDTQGDAANLLRIPAGGSRTPVTEQLVTERKHLIEMEGHEVFRLAVRGVPRIAKAAIEQAGITFDQIKVCALHQANIRIIEAAAKRLDIPYERMIVNVDKYGNTSAASVGIALDEYYRESGLQTDDYVLLVAFGAGFSLGAAVIRWV